MEHQVPPARGAEAKPGSRFDQYEVLELIERGGMGAVHRALDLNLGREVALKFMLPGLDEVAVRRFTREARLLAAIEHPNIVTIFAFMPAGDAPYIAMPLLKGRSLKKALTETPSLSLDRRIDVIRQVLAGLACSHANGVIHRDMKPSNIFLLDSGLVKIIDFGIAHRDDTTTLRAGGLVGTPVYMSPEQAELRELDARSDLFSVGSILYELIAGRPPFLGSTVPDTLHRIATADPDLTPIAAHPPLIPILRRALTKDVNARYQSAQEFASDLASVQVADTTRPVEPIARPRRPQRWMQAATVVVLLLAVTTRHSAVRVPLERASVIPVSPPKPAQKLNDAVRFSDPEPETTIAPIDFAASAPTAQLDLGRGEVLDLILVQPATFLMGEGEPHIPVRVTRPYYIGRYEITADEYEAIVDDLHFNQFAGGRQPVENVSFADAQKFCRLLSARSSSCVRLPTEAEWELACRAGTRTRFSTGDGEAALSRAAWYAKTSGAITHPVGEKAPNRWGLHDMHGNVREWCSDWYADAPPAQSGRTAIDPRGPATGIYRVVRGGSMNSDAVGCDCGYRGRGLPAQRSHERGFRVVVAAGPCS